MSFNDNVTIREKKFHIQTEYYKNKKQIICNIFQDGKVIKKIPLQAEMDDGLEEVVREFHFFVLNKLKHNRQIQSVYKEGKSKQKKENTARVELDLARSVEDIDRDLFSVLQWLSEKKESLVLGIRCSKHNGYIAIFQGEVIAFKCGGFIGYQELQSTIAKKPQLVKIIKSSNLLNYRQFSSFLDVLLENSHAKEKGDDYLIKKGKELAGQLSRLNGFAFSIVLDNSFNIKWGYQEKNLDVNLEVLKTLYLGKMRKLINEISSKYIQVILTSNKFVTIFDLLKNHDSVLLTVFDSKGNYALAQKILREAFASQKK